MFSCLGKYHSGKDPRRIVRIERNQGNAVTIDLHLLYKSLRFLIMVCDQDNRNIPGGYFILAMNKHQVPVIDLRCHAVTRDLQIEILIGVVFDVHTLPSQYLLLCEDA